MIFTPAISRVSSSFSVFGLSVFLVDLETFDVRS